MGETLIIFKDDNEMDLVLVFDEVDRYFRASRHLNLYRAVVGRGLPVF